MTLCWLDLVSEKIKYFDLLFRYLHAWRWKINLTDSGTFYLREISKGSVDEGESCGDGSSKVKGKLLPLATSIIKRGTVPSGHLQIWEAIYSSPGCVLYFTAEWPQKLLVLIRSQKREGSATGPGWCTSCSVLGSHDPADPTLFKLSAADRDTTWSLWQVLDVNLREGI